MSQLNVDDVSLPSSGAGSPTTSTPHKYGPCPYGTLRFPGGDELVSLAEIAEGLRQAQGRYHRLNIQHSELGDARLQRVLDLLRITNEPVANSDGDRAPAAQEGEHPADESEWFRLLVPHLDAWKTHPRAPYHSFRIIELDNNELTSACLPAITAYLTGNLTLHTLSLGGNEIEGDVDAFSNLAKAVGKSALRHLCLSSNPVSRRSMAAFFDSMPQTGTSLERLELSNIMGAQNSTSDDLPNNDTVGAAPVAKSIASFIADPQRCRGLYSLSLDGNSFDARTIRAIISAFIGSGSRPPMFQGKDGPARDVFFRIAYHARPRPPNTSLETLSLLGNLQRGWEPEDLQSERERIEAIERRYARVPLDEFGTIVSFFEARTETRRLEGSCDPDEELPIEVKRHMTTLGVTLDQWEDDFEEAFYFGCGLNMYNWKSLLADQVRRNAYESMYTREAAITLLKAARTLGCRAKKGPLSSKENTSPGFYRFLDLPPELKLHVLRQLDDRDGLTESQFLNVISFACDPTTIGYGQPDFDWSGLLSGLAGAVSNQDRNLSSTLPAEPWNWNNCFTHRAPPRDWSADLMDASDDYNNRAARNILPKPGYSRYRPSLFAFFESTQTQHWAW